MNNHAKATRSGTTRAWATRAGKTRAEKIRAGTTQGGANSFFLVTCMFITS